jgi:hypothetical protein
MSEFWMAVGVLALFAACFGGCAYAHSIPDSKVTRFPRISLARPRSLRMQLTTQQIVIGVGAALIAGLTLFVPWSNVEGYPRGYGFIFYRPSGAARVDWPRVVLPMIAILCATAAGVALTREKVKPAEPDAAPDRRGK